MLKKLLLSLVIIAAVGGVAVASTKALLSDQAVLAANTFSTGSVDLVISNGLSGTLAGSTPGFTESLLPGQTVSKFIRLKNNSTAADFTLTAQTASVSGSLNPADVTVTFTPVDTSESPLLTGTVTSHTLAEWNTPQSLGNPNLLHGTATVSTQEYKMDVKLDKNITTSNASIQFDMVFTGTQVEPTP